MMMDTFPGAMIFGTVVSTLVSATGIWSSEAIGNTYQINSNFKSSTGVYKEDSSTAGVLNNSFEVKPFDILKNQYVIDVAHKTYINLFSYALKDLMRLSSQIADIYGNVSIILKPYYVNKEACLLVEIQGNGDVLEDVNKLKTVCEEWFANTELTVSKNIYIDAV